MVAPERMSSSNSCCSSSSSYGWRATCQQSSQHRKERGRGRSGERSRKDGNAGSSGVRTLASNSGPISRLMPFSDGARVGAGFAGSSRWASSLSLGVRLWKIFAPFTFSIDVRRDSPDPTTVVDFCDFCESVDMRDVRPCAGAGAVPFVAVDSPFRGEDVDVRGAAFFWSVLREKDLLLRGRWAWALDSPSMWAYTVARRAREAR